MTIEYHELTSDIKTNAVFYNLTEYTKVNYYPNPLFTTQISWFIDYNKVLFKSLRNSKRRKKGNFTSKSNSKKIKLSGGGGQHYLVLNKNSTL